jgi:hypothetical protein
MKKISFFYTLLASALLVLSGCIKDKGFEDQKYGINITEIKAVAFPQASGSPVLGSINSQTTPSTVQGPYVTLEQNGSATKDVTVSIVENNTLVTDEGFTPLPAGTYTISTKSPVIAAGKNSSDAVNIVIANSTLLDPLKTYGVGFTISTADQGYGIAANQKSVVIAFSIKNKYDGVYSYSGTIYRNSATGPDMALSGPFTGLKDRSLQTLGANSVSLVPLWATGSGIGGIDGTYITVDPVTNLVTMACSTNPLLKNTVGAVNKYDPATKTFTLAFQWGTAPNTRVTTMTLVYVKPR